MDLENRILFEDNHLIVINKNSGELVFRHPDEHNIAPIQDTNLTIPPVEGGMYLFPGSLYHYVSINYSNEPRFSIAFNLYEPT